MRPTLVALLSACAACSSPNRGSEPIDGRLDASLYTFPLSGTVSDSLTGSQPPVRVVVGVARPEDAGPTIVCDRFIVKFDETAQALPAPYHLDSVPEGQFILVALLIDGSGAAMVPDARVPITVDDLGVHNGGGAPTSTIVIGIEGITAYDCP
jgi:hypothetical protein